MLNNLLLQHIIADADNSATAAAIDAVQELRDIGNTLLSQVPTHLRTGDDEESYRLYFIDAHERASSCHRVCRKWAGPGKLPSRKRPAPPSKGYTGRGGKVGGSVASVADNEFPGGVADIAAAIALDGADAAVTSAGADGDGAGAAVSYKCTAPFVTVLTRRLRRMATQSYQVNLLITAVGRIWHSRLLFERCNDFFFGGGFITRG